MILTRFPMTLASFKKNKESEKEKKKKKKKKVSHPYTHKVLNCVSHTVPTWPTS